MFITISEFAESRKVDRDTINAWIRKHPEVNDSCKMQGKDKVIDTSCEAYQLLEKKYPLPQLLQIVEDTESRVKLIKAQELIIQMQGKMAEQSIIIAKAEVTKALLEDKEKQLKEKDEALSRERSRADQERSRAEELQKELEKERNKSWWQKLRGR